MSIHFNHGWFLRFAVGAIAISAVSLASVWPAVSAGDAAASGMLPPGYSLSHTGDMHDFDYFAGGWTTTQRRLRLRGVGSSDWEAFSAVECLTFISVALPRSTSSTYQPRSTRDSLCGRSMSRSANGP